MTMVSKSRLPDPSSLPADPILDGIPTLRGGPATPGSGGRVFVPTSLIQRGPPPDQLKALESRIAELEAERNQGGVLLKLDPKTVGHSPKANRIEPGLLRGDPDFDDLYESIKKHGQDTPVLVKPAPDNTGPIKYHLVYGHRRHAVVSLLDQETEGGFWLWARLDAVADTKDHFLRMHRENSKRKNLSAYEEGQMYRAALKDGTFVTQKELAEEAQVSQPMITRYIQVAELPSEILVAFRDPRVIVIYWIHKLTAALKANREAVIECARQLATREPIPETKEVLRSLLRAAAKQTKESYEEQIRTGNRKLFTIKRLGNDLTLKFGKSVDARLQDALFEDFKKFAEKKIKEWESS